MAEAEPVGISQDGNSAAHGAKLLKRKREYNSKKWKRMKTLSSKWISGSAPLTPSYVNMYWKPSRGAHSVVWEGPEHLRGFATDENVVATFREAVLSYRDMPREMDVQEERSNDLDHPLLKAPVSLFSADPKAYTATLLRLILPTIMNPFAKRGGFYGSEDNKPTWFPEGMVFKAPTHPNKERGDKTYLVEEMQAILQAFLDKCPAMYRVTADDSAPEAIDEVGGDSDDVLVDDRELVSDPQVALDSLKECTGDDSDSFSARVATVQGRVRLRVPTEAVRVARKRKTCPVRYVLNDAEDEKITCIDVLQEHVIPRGKRQRRAKKTVRPTEDMSVEAKLATIAQTTTWADLKQCVQDMDTLLQDVKVDVIKEGRTFVRDVPANLLDTKRQTLLAGKIPKGFYAVRATANGNCLYNATSVALFGNESRSAELRLASVCHAVDHYDHYVDMYRGMLPTAGDAHQFLSQVVSADSIFDNRPQDKPTPDCIIHHMLLQEILEAAKLGAYSGLLHFQFLSGATQHQVVLHSQRRYDYPMLKPCSCHEQKEAVHIMWVSMNDTRDSQDDPLNHYIPLLPEGGRATHTHAAHSEPPTVKYDRCLMSRHGQCNFSGSTEPTDGIDWIACDRCDGWFHSVCVGFSAEFARDRAFLCMCSSSVSNELAFEMKNDSGYHLVITVDDVRTLYPDRGVSDAIIDFYTQFWIPIGSKRIVGALSYTAIVEAAEGGFTPEVRAQRMVQRFRATCRRPISELLQEDILVFPVKLHTEWHWMAVAVLMKEQRAFVMNSTSADTLDDQSVEAVKVIESFIRAIHDEEFALQPELYKVPQQCGVDCGLHTMHNIAVAAKHQPADFLNKTISKALHFNAKVMRARLLTECCINNLHYMRTKKPRQQPLRPTTRGTVAKKEEFKQHSMKIRSKLEDGLSVVDVEGKGRGVISTRAFKKGELVCEYSGELISHTEAKQREERYLKDSSIGCYTYYFEYKAKKLCVDATKDNGRMGRLLNHSKTGSNLVTRLLEVDDRPCLCLMAARHIQPGEELLYDYGERSSEVILSHPWLKE